jgi:uncharacterized protein (TIRG00374 family)
MNSALRLVVSVALLGLLFIYFVDVTDVAHLLVSFDLRYVALAALVITADRALMTYKWILLLRKQGYRLPLIDGMAIYCSSMLWGTVLPSTLGADAIRTVLVIKRGGIGGTDVVASIILERVIGFIATLLLGICSLATLRYVGIVSGQYDGVLYLFVAALSGATLLLAISMESATTDRLVAITPVGIRQSKPVRTLQQVGNAYQALGTARGTLAWFGVLSFIEQFGTIALTWVLAQGVGVPVDALVLFGVVPIVNLVSRLPVTIDGLGVYEAMFAGLLSLAGVAPEASLAIAFSGRIIQLFCFAPWWLVQVVQSGQLRPPPPVELPVPEPVRHGRSRHS